ncbi:hypothetical protein LWI29_029989 [Acer saccharum]|uniref:TF-B3 domain-containing protein n=1 Tax=Acer saccharum TaxID=4024 RepID=A0AA39T4L1_ACESA|nr:hypothetical protein LWI29_029989 [Acer saccharum]
MLTRADIERRLTIPRYYVGAFPDVQENQAVELKVKDEMGHAWTFRCSLESAISPRLVFSSGWLHFASIPVDRPQPGPVLIPCTFGDGGVQGLRWYAKCLRIDEDGDVANEFLDEVLTETSVNVEEKHTPLSKFEVRYSTKPVKVKNQVSLDRRIQQCVEYQGRQQWV